MRLSFLVREGAFESGWTGGVELVCRPLATARARIDGRLRELAIVVNVRVCGKRDCRFQQIQSSQIGNNLESDLKEGQPRWMMLTPPSRDSRLGWHSPRVELAKPLLPTSEIVQVMLLETHHTIQRYIKKTRWPRVVRHARFAFDIQFGAENIFTYVKASCACP